MDLGLILGVSIPLIILLIVIIVIVKIRISDHHDDSYNSETEKEID